MTSMVNKVETVLGKGFFKGLAGSITMIASYIFLAYFIVYVGESTYDVVAGTALFTAFRLVVMFLVFAFLIQTSINIVSWVRRNKLV